MSSVIIRIFVVDAHPIYRMGLQTLASQHEDFAVVGQTGDADEALSLILQQEPDVVVMATNLPPRRTLSLAEELRATRPDLCLVAVTALEEPRLLFELIARRVSGIVMKHDPPDELVDAIRNAKAGQAGTFGQGVLALLHEQRTDSHDWSAAGLSRREREILRLVARGYRNQQIADNLFISPNTVRNHLANIFEKLDVNRRAEAVAWAWTNGLVAEE